MEGLGINDDEAFGNERGGSLGSGDLGEELDVGGLREARREVGEVGEGPKIKDLPVLGLVGGPHEFLLQRFGVSNSDKDEPVARGVRERMTRHQNEAVGFVLGLGESIIFCPPGLPK
jgi:hypothetical protein